MLIRHTDPEAPSGSDITPETAYRQRSRRLPASDGGAGDPWAQPSISRRHLLQAGAAIGAAGLILPGTAQAATRIYNPEAERPDAPAWLRNQIARRGVATNNPTGETLTPYRDATNYNNFYEFGTGKSDPADKAGSLRIQPWSVRVDGLCDKPGNYALEDLLKPHAMQDRIYRFRCVEAWSMVVPWLGVSLGDVLRRFAPKSNARFVHFTTLLDSKQFPAQRTPILDWPYREGLRLDEAMHPLTLLATGLYGRSLPDQNGAPLRLIVPWKYGFKSIKSIVRITFSDKAPVTTWMGMAPEEYGFFANVNPAVAHPRWSQSRERRLPNSLFSPNWKPTLPFNGYARQVAGLYRGMDLAKWF